MFIQADMLNANNYNLLQINNGGNTTIPTMYNNNLVLCTGFDQESTVTIQQDLIPQPVGTGTMGQFIYVANSGDPAAQPNLIAKIYNNRMPILEMGSSVTKVQVTIPYGSTALFYYNYPNAPVICCIIIPGQLAGDFQIITAQDIQTQTLEAAQSIYSQDKITAKNELAVDGDIKLTKTLADFGTTPIQTNGSVKVGALGTELTTIGLAAVTASASALYSAGQVVITVNGRTLRLDTANGSQIPGDLSVGGNLNSGQIITQHIQAGINSQPNATLEPQVLQFSGANGADPVADYSGNQTYLKNGTKTNTITAEQVRLTDTSQGSASIQIDFQSIALSGGAGNIVGISPGQVQARNGSNASILNMGDIEVDKNSKKIILDPDSGSSVEGNIKLIGGGTSADPMLQVTGNRIQFISSYSPQGIHDPADVNYVQTRFGTVQVIQAAFQPATVKWGDHFLLWATTGTTFTLPKLADLRAAGVPDGTSFYIHGFRTGITYPIAATDNIITSDGVPWNNKVQFGELWMVEMSGSNWRFTRVSQRQAAMFYPSPTVNVTDIVSGDCFMSTGNIDGTITIPTSASLGAITNGTRFFVSAFMNTGHKVTVKVGDKIIKADPTQSQGYLSVTEQDVAAGETWLFVWDAAFTQWFGIKN